MSMHDVQFGIASSMDSDQPAYRYYPTMERRDAALRRLHQAARRQTDGRVRLYQKVLSMGEGLVALELPLAAPVSYAAVRMNVPDTEFPVVYDMAGRVELFSGEVEVLPEGTEQKEALRRAQHSVRHRNQARMQDFYLMQPAGQHSDRCDRTVYVRIVHASNRTGLRAQETKNLRSNLLRAKALQRLQDARPNAAISADQRQLIVRAPLQQLLPAN